MLGDAFSLTIQGFWRAKPARKAGTFSCEVHNAGMEVEFVPHARRRMEERGVTEDMVSEILIDAD